MDERILFHVDVNSAFLSWTAVRRLRDDPGSVDLRLIPAAVCGDVETRHGVILAKSIPAKACGVHTGEAVMTALKKCPRLLLVPSEFSTYRDASRRLMAMLREVSPYLEQLSIDEAFLDVTHRTGRDGAPALAEELKDRIRETLGFTVNVGISTNRLLAKTASDFTKPDRVHVLWPEEVPARLWPLPIGDLFGCGRATAEKLRSIGIATIGDAAHTPSGVLTALLGPRGGAHLLESAWGRSSDRLVCDPEDAKGYSREETTPIDIDADNFEAAAVPLIRTLSESVAGRLRRDGVYASTIGFSVKTDAFQRRSRQTTLKDSTNSGAAISGTVLRLARDFLTGPDGLFAKGVRVRLIGVSATRLDRGEYRQLNLFDYGRSLEAERKQQAFRKKEAALDAMLESVRKKYGADIVRRGAGQEEEPQ